MGARGTRENLCKSGDPSDPVVIISAADFGFRFFLGFSSLIVRSYGLIFAAKLRKEMGTCKYLRHEFSSQRKTVN
jgi:hypothetical protein